jgi:hypothetical protein
VPDGHAALMPKSRRCPMQRRARVQLSRPLFTALLLLYPSVSIAALALLACTPAVLTARAYAAATHDAGQVAV